jgi:Transposase DDE domain
VDSTGLKLCGAGEWLVEKHGTKTRGSWRKLHIDMDADAGEIVAAALTTKDVDDASQVSFMLDQIEGPIASFTGDGAYDQDSVYQTVTDRDPDATVIVPPRDTATLSDPAETEPTQRAPISNAPLGRVGSAGKKHQATTSVGRKAHLCENVR